MKEQFRLPAMRMSPAHSAKLCTHRSTARDFPLNKIDVTNGQILLEDIEKAPTNVADP